MCLCLKIQQLACIVLSIQCVCCCCIFSSSIFITNFTTCCFHRFIYVSCVYLCVCLDESMCYGAVALIDLARDFSCGEVFSLYADFQWNARFDTFFLCTISRIHTHIESQSHINTTSIQVISYNLDACRSLV